MSFPSIHASARDNTNHRGNALVHRDNAQPADDAVVLGAVPTWLQDICFRLRASDPTLTTIKVPQREGYPVPVSVTPPMMDALVEALRAGARARNELDQSNRQSPEMGAVDNKGNGGASAYSKGKKKSSRRVQCHEIKMLCLSGCMTKNPWAIRSLTTHILPSHNQHIMTLSLSSNDLKDEHAALIAKSLATNTTIEELYLSSNLITDDGCCALAEAIHPKISLKVLTLSWNSIGARGCIALADKLRTNNTLVRLDLLGNSIPEAGADAMKRTLRTTNYNLEELWLSANWEVTYDQKHTIDAYCRSNRTVKKLYQRMKHEGIDETVSVATAAKEELPIVSSDSGVQGPEKRKGTKSETTTRQIPLRVWAYALERIATKPDLLFEILRQKSPTLLCGSNGGSGPDERGNAPLAVTSPNKISQTNKRIRRSYTDVATK